MHIELQTKRLRLRPLCYEDLKALYEFSSDRENIPYMLFFPHETFEEAEHFLQDTVKEWAKEEPNYYEFAMEYEGRLIGNISAYKEDGGKEVEFGWLIHKDYRGMGFALEAALAIKKFAVEQLRPERLTAHCDKRNHDSEKLMKKIGLTYAGEGIREYRSGIKAAELAYVEWLK